ncbi:NAD(P)H-binding protein [Nonomuraea angiospora]
MVMVVFGARGSVGRHVAAGLLAAGERVRVTSRDPGKGGLPDSAEVVAADLELPETLPAALEGATKVFVYAKPDGVEGFVEAARSAGVRQVVLLSSAAIVMEGSERNPIAVQHRIVETAVEGSGLDWTFIRPGMFATNTRWWWQATIRGGGVVRLPYPESETAPIHEKDLAALTVTALTEPGHERQAYTVYGVESLTLRRQVEHIGEAIGRPIDIEVVSEAQAREEMARTVPAVGVEVIMKQWAARDGIPAPTSNVVEKVTGHPGHTFAEWAADHADDFR